jgi:hypothetical protein
MLLLAVHTPVFRLGAQTKGSKLTRQGKYHMVSPLPELLYIAVPVFHCFV